MEDNVQNLNTPALVIYDVDDADVPWYEGQSIAQTWSEVRFIKTRNWVTAEYYAIQPQLQRL